MSQISENRRKRKIRRIIGFSLTGVILLAAIIFWLTREEPPPTVRVGSLYTGDIASVMMVSAQIQPGSVQEDTPSQYQRVINVNVSVGDQVNKGDVLLTLDQSELREQYEQAQEARQQVEASIAQSDAAAAAQAAALKAQEDAAKEQARLAQDAQQEFSRQTAALASSLSETTAELVKLTSIQPSVIELDPELSARLLADLSDFDPQAPDSQEQLTTAIAMLQENIALSENPEYTQQLTALEAELQKLSGITGSLLGALNTANSFSTGLSTDLTSQLTNQLSDQLADQLGGLGGLGGIGSSLESALAQALAYEQAAEKSLADSVEELRASSSGLVAQINVSPGDHIGSSSLAAVDPSSLAAGGMDLSALLGSGTSIPGTVSTQPAVVIYDNTRPKAVFQASQFDSKRIEKGMPVEFDYDGQFFSGSISFIAPYATGSQFGSSIGGVGGAGSALSAELSGLSGISDLSGEPTLLVEMEINGSGLDQLIPGFKIDASIQTDSAEDVLILPAEAMRREIDTWYVYVVDQDNKLVRKEFTAGIQAEMTVQVIDGLSIDDRVVLNPSNQLTDGMLVEINNDQTDS
ncbi:MAG: biotin/lipoyl-binding protein [Clostridiaceae bacterium]|nr:biotin/lipoyl-binding protein [Clostridiaceae bacterium]